MKFIFGAIIACLMLTSAAGADLSDEPRFQRANLLVSDMERAFTFYRDVLGFDVFRVSTHGKSSYAYEIFQIESKADLKEAMLSTATQKRVLGLTEVKNLAIGRTPIPNRVAIVIEVQDLDQLVAKSIKLGLQVFSEDSLMTVDGKIIREQGILDWDGNLILIYMYVDASAK